MKKITTLFILALSIQSYAIDRFVNPNLSSGNGTTLFTNITSAVNAAVNGDRIIVASNTYNEAALTIGKSLQIMPQTPGTTINFNANITIAGFPGMKLEITGFNLGIYFFNSTAISGGSATNRAKISIINCSSEYLWFEHNFYESNFIENQIDKGILFKHGNVIKNITKQISLLDEPQNNPNTSDRNLIIANQVQFMIGVLNNDYPVIVANNSMRDLSFRRWNTNENLINYVINNNFTSGSVLQFSIFNVPRYNIVASSNNFESQFFMANLSDITPSSIPSSPLNYDNSDVINGWNGSFSPFIYNAWFEYIAGPGFLCGWYPCFGTGPNLNANPTRPTPPNFNFWASNGSSIIPNINVSGFFEFSYNGLQTTFNTPSSGSPLNLTNIPGQIEPINGGNPNHAFYDIDLTINDRGINGGPFSQLNYNATNINNSKAFIFDLDMPADLFPGQNVEIKAKGYHKN